jgi:EpsI family protein
MPVYRGALDMKQTYRKDGQVLYLYIGYYPVQRQGSELISDLNSISGGKSWTEQYPHGRPASAAGLDVLEQQLLSDSGSQRLVWYWYRIAGQDTSSSYMAKVLQLLGFVTGEPQAAVLAVAADAGTDAGQTRRVMGGFLAAMRPALAQIAGGRFN